jgi:hypothetical protein
VALSDSTQANLAGLGIRAGGWHAGDAA